MALPSDQKLAKLRILLRRAEAARDEAMREAKRIADAAWAATMPKREAADSLWFQFMERCEELGYCPFCELPKSQCKGHISLAA